MGSFSSHSFLDSHFDFFKTEGSGSPFNTEMSSRSGESLSPKGSIQREDLLVPELTKRSFLITNNSN